jgi:hypothetical protein
MTVGQLHLPSFHRWVFEFNPKPKTLMNMKDPEVEFIIKSMAWKTIIWIFYWGTQFKIEFSCLGQAMILYAGA